VELIDAATSRNLWAEAFEGQMSDIFAIQSEIAEKLAAKLQVQLSAETEKALVRAPTVDPEAYQLVVLRGRYLRNREVPEDLLKAGGRHALEMTYAPPPATLSSPAAGWLRTCSVPRRRE
jgi:hypothetical protein